MKKFLVFLLLTLTLAFCAIPALAAGEDKDDATLAELLVNDEAVTIRNNMTVDVPIYADEVSLSFTTSYKKADVQVSCSGNCQYNEKKELLSLSGQTEQGVKHSVSITVTSYNGDNSKKYTLNLVRAYSDELLSGLSVNTSATAKDKGLMLLPAKEFDAADYNYELKLEDSSVESIYLWIDTDSANDVWVNGSKVKSKNRLPYEIELADIKEPIELIIEDEDPLNRAVYSIKLSQSGSVGTKKALSALSVSKSKSTASAKLFQLYPEFAPENGNYHVFLANGSNAAYILAEAADEDDYVYYNYKAGVTTKADNHNQKWYALSDIKEGSVLPIQIIDDNNKNAGSYSLTFHCGKASDNNDVDLDSLSVSNQIGESKYENIKLDKTFAYNVKSYSATIPANSYKKVRIYAEAFDTNAYVLVNGELVGKKGYVELSCVDGTSSTYDIQVIAANCDDSSSYQLTLNYGDVKPQSRGAYLSGLSAKVYGGAALSLSPIFVSEKLNYTANVPNSVSYVSFYPSTAASSNAQIELFGYKQDRDKWTNYYQMNEGINNIPLYVYEGETKDQANIYYVTIYRQPAHLSTVVSSQKLTVDGKAVQLNAYNINGNNFVKLRDIAYLLNGTAKQFQVKFESSSNSIFITPATAYTSVGQENVALASPKKVQASKQAVYLNSARVEPMAYNIDGNNYLMLRDLALLLDFGMTYDSSTGTVAISTANSYSPNK